MDLEASSYQVQVLSAKSPVRLCLLFSIRKMKKNNFYLLTLPLIVVLAAALTALSACSRPAYKVKQISDLSYVEGGKSYFQLLDLYLPEKETQAKLPVIVWIHGGSWRYGDKKDTPAVWFAQRGYAVASLNYTLSDKAPFPAQIKDCKAAIRWLRGHAAEYNLDPDRFGAFGMSAGGHLVALLGVTNNDKQFDDFGDYQKLTSNVQAVCDWCGPTDMFTLQKQSTGRTQINWIGKDAPLTKFLGDKLENVSDLAHKASAVEFVKADSPPFLIMHGDKDQVVPFAQSQELFDALKKAHADVQLVVVKDGQHIFASPENFEIASKFFDDKLKNK